MVMRGGGRSREIQRLQAAQQGGQATARQQQRLDYLQDNRGAGRRPQGPQTGGPLQQAMGAAGRSLAGAAAGGDELRFQQPWTGGASNGGTTWDGQAPMNPYGGGNMQQQPDRARVRMGPDGRMIMPTAQELEQSAQDWGKRMGMTPEQFNQYREAANNNGERSMQAPSMPPGFTTYPLKINQNDPSFQKQMPPQPMQRPTPQGPNYFQGEGMGADRFSKFGSPPPPQQPVQGDWFRGGGMDNGRFAKFGTPAPMQTQVQGNQIRGGGFGPRTQRVNKNRGSQPAGVLAQPPGKIVPY